MSTNTPSPLHNSVRSGSVCIGVGAGLKVQKTQLNGPSSAPEDDGGGPSTRGQYWGAGGAWLQPEAAGNGAPERHRPVRCARGAARNGAASGKAEVIM